MNRQIYGLNLCLEREVGFHPLEKEKIKTPLQSLATIAIKEWSSPTATSQFIFTALCSSLFQKETIGLEGTRETLVSTKKVFIKFFQDYLKIFV